MNNSNVYNMGKVASLPVAQPTNVLLRPLKELRSLPTGTLLHIVKMKDGLAVDYICPFYGYDNGNVFSKCGYVQISGGKQSFEFISKTSEFIMGRYVTHDDAPTETDMCSIQLATENEKRTFWHYYEEYEDRLWTFELNSYPHERLITVRERCKIETGNAKSTMICEFLKYDKKTDQISVRRCVRFIEKKGEDTVVEVTNYAGTTFYFKSVERITVPTDDEVTLFNKYVGQGRPYEKVTFQIHNEIKPAEEKKYDGYISPCKMKAFMSKVLVCDGEGKIWKPAVFGYKTKDGRVCTVGGELWTHCLDFRNHRDLLGVKCKKEHFKE